MKKEIWKIIHNFNDDYKISNYGNVKYKGKNLNIFSLGAGYCGVYLKLKNKIFYIHRLVAENFIPNLKNKKEINHKDGVKNNNYVNNLEWSNRKLNMQHAWNNNLIKKDKFLGENNINSKLIKKQVIEIRKKYIPRKYTLIALAKEYNVSLLTIHNIIKQKTWKNI